MFIGALFKSKQERERDAKAKRRKAFREAEGAVGAVRDRVKKLKTERDLAWAGARVYLRDGQKSAAQRLLQSVRAGEIMMTRLEAKRWVFEQLLTKLEMAKTDQEFAAALAAVNQVVRIDPEAVADVLGNAEDTLGDQGDTDRLWEKMHAKEMEGAASSLADAVPSLDQMLRDLEDEVATANESDVVSRTADVERAADDDGASTRELRGRARRVIEGNLS